jgi:hypothetical protein
LRRQTGGGEGRIRHSKKEEETNRWFPRELTTLLPSLGRFCAIFGLAMCLALVAGHAAEPPDNIAEALDEAARACRDMNGVPNTDAVLKVEDLNGDGGCTLQLYVWDGATAWDLVFEDLVQSYKFGKNGGKRMLYVTTSGLPCNKPAAESCKWTYRLEKDAVVPVE